MSTIYFPQIGSGLLTQRPYRATQSFNSILADAPTGRPYAFLRRGSGLNYYPTVPLGRWNLNYSAITDTEVQQLKTFHSSMAGKLGEFIFLDPAGNLIPVSEDWTDPSWNPTGVTVGASTTDPFGGALAYTLTGTTSSSSLAPTVIPLGSLPANFLMSFSVYARAHSSGQYMTIGFVTPGLSVIARTTWLMPQGQWIRAFTSASINTSSTILAQIGFGSTIIDFFGPHCCPTGGPGAYVQSPINYGYHPTVRFDTDTFKQVAVGPNANSVQLPLIETNG
jgi:hypothetical protein